MNAYREILAIEPLRLEVVKDHLEANAFSGYDVRLARLMGVEPHKMRS